MILKSMQYDYHHVYTVNYEYKIIKGTNYDCTHKPAI